MSSRVSRVPPQRRNTRNTRSRRNVLDMDLNALPHENRDDVGSSAQANSWDMPAGQQGGPTQPAPIDVEAFDDEVFISSFRAFAEAKNNSRRNRGNTMVVDVDSEDITTPVVEIIVPRVKRRRLASGQTSTHSDELYINLEGSSNTVVTVHEPPPPPPRETTFTCPVCLGQLVEATSTKCGHIFCKGCLRTALAVQGKCPTCRKRSTLRGTIRVYLPGTN